jgi:hypothetical protein
MIVHYKPAFVLFFESLYCRAKKPHSSPPLLLEQSYNLKNKKGKERTKKLYNRKGLKRTPNIKQGA